MSIDDIVCTECESEDISEKKTRNLYNLAIGFSIGTTLGILINMGLIALAPAFYFMDVPFGANKEYYCNKCDYHWYAD